MFLLNLYWLYDHINLYITYNFSDVLVNFILPDYFLIINSIVALVFMFISVFICFDKIKQMRKWALINIASLLLFSIFHVIIVM